MAVGFMVLVGTAAAMGVLVGTIGGAVVWRLRGNLALGGVLTGCAYLLVLIVDHHEDFLWLRAKLTWGVPSMTLAFLICAVSARWLEAHQAPSHVDCFGGVRVQLEHGIPVLAAVQNQPADTACLGAGSRFLSDPSSDE